MKFMLQTVKEFFRDSRGNIAMMFGLAMVPICIAAGAGVDYTRSEVVRQQMADALDTATLAVGSTTGLNQSSAQALAQKYFTANYNGDMTNGVPVITITNFTATGSVTATATYTLPTTLLKVIGRNSVAISTSSTVVWGQSKLWVSLVLDNSGSMAQGDSTGSKMDALQNASHQLLTILQDAATNAGDVKVSIVPFDRYVNVGKSNVNASWIDWTEWAAEPANTGLNGTTDTLGPGETCPFATINGWGQIQQMSPYGYNCVNSATNGASSTSTIPSSGLICPGTDSGDYNTYRRSVYYNGCYTSAATGSKKTVSSGNSATCNGHSASNCSCSGNGNAKKCKAINYKHTWVPNAHSTWGGCITDRDKTNEYDISNTAPNSTAKNFPAVNTSNCLDSTVTPLSYSWSTLSNQIDAMAPNASTNQAIGMAHGWQTLSNSDPYNPGALPTNTTRYIIILSDGLNTQDHWWGNGHSEGTTEDGYIDDRMDKTCSAAKADGIVVYSIFLHIGSSGNSAPLQNCASDSTKYFNLTTTSAVVTTFNQIAQQITNVRVSR